MARPSRRVHRDEQVLARCDLNALLGELCRTRGRADHEIFHDEFAGIAVDHRDAAPKLAHGLHQNHRATEAHDTVESPPQPGDGWEIVDEPVTWLVENGSKAVLSSDDDVLTSDIRRADPMEIALVGLAVALILEVVLSGGKLTLGPLQVELPPLGKGIEILPCGNGNTLTSEAG
jgi:hypothetical protein